MSKEQKTLQPRYVQKFRCIGGKCEHTCCSALWNIFIDKDTYKLYKKCPDAKLRQKLDKNITRNRTNSNDMAYAKIKMGTGDNCPFLDKENLCSLQRSRGEKYLSVTCMTYPRHCNIVKSLFTVFYYHLIFTWISSIFHVYCCEHAIVIAPMNSKKQGFLSWKLKTVNRL